MTFRARLVCVCLMLGLSGCPQQARLDGDGTEDINDDRTGAVAEDGADGSDGANGADGRNGVDGANGADGANGTEGANGADGADGRDGLSSLVRVRQEEGSSACPAGGSVVESGIDRDGDLVLDDEEVDSSALICNGTDGADAEEEAEVARDREPCLLEQVDGLLQLACEDGTHELETEALMPEVVTASSVAGGLTPAHAAWEDQAGWMSEVESGNPEWLQYDFGVPVVLTHVRALAVNGRQGWHPMIQGSNDGETWSDIHALGQGERNRAPWVGYVRMDESISTTTAYRFVRLYTTPVAFMYYAWLGFDGAMMQ